MWVTWQSYDLPECFSCASCSWGDTEGNFCEAGDLFWDRCYLILSDDQTGNIYFFRNGKLAYFCILFFFSPQFPLSITILIVHLGMSRRPSQSLPTSSGDCYCCCQDIPLFQSKRNKSCLRLKEKLMAISTKLKVESRWRGSFTSVFIQLWINVHLKRSLLFVFSL